MIDKKILLILLPYWTPLLPPQGMSRIKGFLRQQGCRVKTVDVNLDNRFKRLYNKYFDRLKEFIPQHKLGNLYNIGNDAWREHMMAHINHEDKEKEKYIELVKIILHSVFFHDLDDSQINALNSILDELYGLLESYTIQLLEEEKPDLLGLSVYRDTLPASLFVFRTARQHNPGLLTVMGGSIFTIQLTPGTPNLEYFLEKTRAYIDKIIVGEGEIPLLKLLKGEIPDSKRFITKEDVEGQTIGFPPVEMSDFSDFNPENYNYVAAQGSASCPNDCSFCNVPAFYGKYREKDTKLTVDEMVYMNKKYNCQLFFMNDSLLNNVMTPISEEMIRRGLSLYMDGYFRVPESITPEEAHLWRRGGFYRARIGVESGSQKLLDLMNKGITVEQIRHTVSTLADAGIKTTLYFVMGHPGETEDDFQQTLNLLEELKNDIWEAECNPFLYFYDGQPSNNEWSNKRILVYPEWAKDMLITQTWRVNMEPSRREMYSRICRFAELGKKLGTILPWSIHGVNRADERWQKLHVNAVPAVSHLLKNRNTDENKYVKMLQYATVVEEEDDNFNF